MFHEIVSYCHALSSPHKELNHISSEWLEWTVSWSVEDTETCWGDEGDPALRGPSFALPPVPHLGGQPAERPGNKWPGMLAAPLLKEKTDSLVLKTVKFGFKNNLVLPILLRKKPRPRKNGWFAQSQSSLDSEMKLEHRWLPRAIPFIICQGPSVYGWLKVSQNNSWPLS